MCTPYSTPRFTIYITVFPTIFYLKHLSSLQLQTSPSFLMYLLCQALHLIFSIIISCVFSCTSYRILNLFEFRCSFVVFFRFIVFNKSHNSYSLPICPFFFYINYLSSLQLQTTLLSICYHLLHHARVSKNIYPPPHY